MDSESPVAFGTAGQPRIDTGTPFTSNVATVKSEFGFGLDANGGTRRPPGSTSHRRRADGDGL